MPYAQNRTYYDSDSHLMETFDWLNDHASAAERALIKPFTPKNAGPAVSAMIGKAEARRADAEATAALLDHPLISGPKGWLAYGASTPGERTKALDLLGFKRQIVFPTFSLGQFALSRNLETVYAGTSALNRGMAAFCADDPRLMAVGFLPLTDTARAVETLETGLRNGISAFWVPSDPPEGRSPAHVDYEPIWARLAEAKVPVVLHLGGGRLLPPAYHENGRPRPTDFLGGGENLRGKDYPAVSHSPENFLNALVLDGVFQRHENLRCGVIELGATWVPGFIRMLDHAAHAFRKTEPLIAGLELKPSEYIKRQVRFSLFPYEEPGWLIEQAGADLFMFASDFPHPEGGRDPIGSFDKSFEAHATNEIAREKFYSGNFAHMMSMPA